jgi:hypothetical protein
MSAALRDALHAAASDAGRSLNAFALEGLASAAGDAAQFRSERPAAPEPPAPADIPRDGNGYPLDRLQRGEHRAARTVFLFRKADETDTETAKRLADQYDREDPAFYVEWLRGLRTE